MLRHTIAPKPPMPATTACTFASTFFDRLTQGQTFGDAIFAARKAAHQQHPASNTWGAYQAYGDYETMMELLQAMVCHMAQKVLGTLVIEHKDKEGNH